MKERTIAPLVQEDLLEKMVFVAGPRQCGKTTLAEGVLQRIGGSYYSWDIDAHRRLLRKSSIGSRTQRE